MAARLRLVSTGPGATIQDSGRFGNLRYGVTPAGPMDWTAFQTVCRALGNDERAAAIEVSVGGLSVIAEEGVLRIAFAGGAFDWRRDGAKLPRAALLPLRPGEILSAQAGPEGAWAYLGVAGGFDTPVELGSRATHTRSGIGGLDGRMLRAGDILPVAAGERPDAITEAEIEAPCLEASAAPIRVILGPQHDYFSVSGLKAFFGESFILTPAADRMAYRFSGAPIDHAHGYNIVSDGAALGAIQVAGDRAPLILMADRQPTGGYPKLGHVIRSDIGRLAQMRPGESCRFSAVTLDEARAALRALEAEIAATRAHLGSLRRQPTTGLLLEANLIDGVADAQDQSR
jgi:biotin-dependent carboxylase-like uncharacterized protein